MNGNKMVYFLFLLIKNQKQNNPESQQMCNDAGNRLHLKGYKSRMSNYQKSLQWKQFN